MKKYHASVKTGLSIISDGLYLYIRIYERVVESGKERKKLLKVIVSDYSLLNIEINALRLAYSNINIQIHK